MPISLVGSAAGTTSVTMPTHQVGDLLLMFAFRDGSTTNPTIGTGTPTAWTTITNTTDGTTCSVSAAWKRAAATNETSGTWTNASRVVCIVLRGVQDTGTPIGTFAPTAGTTNTVTYTSRTQAGDAGGSWFVAFAGHRSVDTTIGTAPSGMVQIRTDEDATAEVACFATTNRAGTSYGPATGDWPSTNVSITGTASGWQTMVIEILADYNELNNYHRFKTPDNSTGANAGVLGINGGMG